MPSTFEAYYAGMQPPRSCLKASVTAEGAGTFHSLWKVAGNPGAGSNPPAYTAGAGYQATNATAGAVPYTNAVAGDTRLAMLSCSGSTVGALLVYDRLWACSGLTTAAATTLNITTPGDLPARDLNGSTDGAGVELWGEVYTAPGATGATWTVSYTNSTATGGARTATYTHPANAESVGQMLPFTLAAGDVGVRSVASFTTSISSGTAGDIGLTLMRRIGQIPITTANIGALADGVALGLPPIYDNACLFFVVMCSTTNTGIVMPHLAWSQGA